MFRRAMVLLLFVGLVSCQSLSPSEKQRYDNLISQGAEPIRKKEPAAASILNLAIGIGDIYNGQWSALPVDFLLWPLSVLWAVPQGAITANNINKKSTLAYYTVGDGKGLYDADSPASSRQELR